jgi:hypothetical protein
MLVPSMISSSGTREGICFFLYMPLAILWKHLVFESPLRINCLLDHLYHLISSSVSTLAMWAWILTRLLSVRETDLFLGT